MEEGVIWTDLTVTDITDRLAQQGSPVSVHVVEQLLEMAGYRRRQAQKYRSMDEHADRDA